MSKKSEDRTNSTDEKNQTDDLQALIEQVDKKAQEFEDKKREANPDGRLSWNQLFEMFVLIEGWDPRGQPPQKNNKGIVNRQYRDSDLFSSKLKTNSTEVRDQFVVLNEVMPKFEDTDQAQEYFDKKRALIKEYTSINDISQFTDQELQEFIQQRGKSEEFKGEAEQLDSEYPEVVDKLDQQQEFKRKPLVKCDFDMIKKRDTAGTGLSANQLRTLDPMLDF